MIQQPSDDIATEETLLATDLIPFADLRIDPTTIPSPDPFLEQNPAHRYLQRLG
jgi:hypothetical protein